MVTTTTSNPFRKRRRHNATAKFPLPLLLCCLLLLEHRFQQYPVADAFATYLLGNMGCMTDLSTDEVIMNSQVVSATDSSHPKVHLALASEQPNDEANLRVEDSTKIYVTPPPPPNDKVVLIDLRLNTEDYADLKDVQFVVDVESGSEDGESTSSASLINGQCDDNKRVAARGHDTVTLKLSTDDAIATEPVRVWAGWATGHEAVRLTPVLEFYIVSSSGNHNDAPTTSESDNHENNHEEQEDGEEHKVRPSLNAYKHHKDGEVKHKEPPNSRSNKDTEENSNSDHRKEKVNNHDNQESSKPKKNAASSGRGRRSKPISHATRGDDDNETSRKKKKRKPNPRSDLSSQQRQRKTLDDVRKTPKQQQDNANNKKEAGIDIDTTWFLYGLGILVVGNLLVVQICTHLTGGRGGSMKGRLSL